MGGENGLHLGPRVRDASVLNIGGHAVDDLDVGGVLEDGVGDDPAHLDRRERVEHEHHHPPLPPIWLTT